MSNVDTDQIMPKQFLKRVERTGYGEYLFYDWKKDPKFPLNNDIYKNSKVLVPLNLGKYFKKSKS